MTTIRRRHLLLFFATCLLAFASATQPVSALPLNQTFPCFGGEGCPELINPQADEYYAVQCTNNAVWVWRAVPAPALVTFVPVFQIESLGEGQPFAAPGEVTVIRSGDTITLSGANGNLAPQPGEKSFLWSACVALNGGLPELPPVVQDLSDEQLACLNLTSEQEKEDCLAALEAETDSANTPGCDDALYAQTHVEECLFVSCPLDRSRRVADESLCPDALEILYQELNAILDFCLGPPVTIGAGVISFAAFSRRRRRR